MSTARKVALFPDQTPARSRIAANHRSHAKAAIAALLLFDAMPRRRFYRDSMPPSEIR
jgi:uncharacterized protein (DUF924 family)